MPIPQGFDPVLGYFLLWIGLAVVLLGAFGQLPKDEEFGDRVSARTFIRLGALNEYLDEHVGLAWDEVPQGDIVPDLASLRSLKRMVDRAAAVDTRLVRRKSVTDFGRLMLLLNIAAAFLLGLAVFVLGPISRLITAAELIATVGFALSIVCLVASGWMGWRIDHGEDV